MASEFDVAIVGMSCRFPGARTVAEFWQNVADGVESISRLSDQELLESGVPQADLANPAYVKAAPILEEPALFDAAFFGFSPTEARTMDPQQRILLELAYEALEDAACVPDRYQGRIGVFAGAAMNTYFMQSGLNRKFIEDYIPTLIANDKDFLSTRISYKLNLKGPSITIQTACSTSLVAVHLARQSLLTEETDMALAGAISVRVPHKVGYFYDGGGVVSPDGHVRAFDAKANGTVFGSGGGVIVLKRLADALSDGDTIYAVLKGSAVNNDGSEKAGYSAPSVNSQAEVVVEALANAGVDADSITYVEAHGSGTPVGDPIEILALSKAFRASAQRSGYCAIGSVKTNVGHLDAAAGIAGIIKTALALKHGMLPPSLNYSQPNPEIDFPSTPFFVNTRLGQWTSRGPKRAGVMATGMGGTNAHVVLEEAPEPGERSNSGHSHLLVLSARNETALDLATQRLREFAKRNAAVNMGDVAYTLQVGRIAFSHRRILVCSGRDDAIAALDEENSKRILSSRADESSRRPLILLLPGVGDHYVGMAYDLYQSWDVFKKEVDRCARLLEPHLGMDIREIIYPRSLSWKETGTHGIDLKKMLGRKTDETETPDSMRLNQTLCAQPALFTVEYALARLWEYFGIRPTAILGHSMGEYVAACLAGVFSLEDALRLIATRAKLVHELPQGAMLAVTLPEHEILPLLSEDLSISLINGPNLCVVAGPVEVVAAFQLMLNERGVICRHVQNAHAFHSKMLNPIVDALEAEVRKVKLSEPRLPFISNVTGTWISRAEATEPAYWARHATHPARFSDALHHMWQFHNCILLEAGPGRTLGVLALQHSDRNKAGNPVTISSLRHHYENQSDVGYLWQSVGKLWLSGVEINWKNLHADGQWRRVSLPTYPFERQKYWMETVPVPDVVRQTSQTEFSVQKDPDISRWFYVPSWRRLLPKTAGVHEVLAWTQKRRVWLFYSDECGFASQLMTRLKAAGQDVVTVKSGRSYQQVDANTFTIEAANAQHYDLLIRSLQANKRVPDHVVHAWSLTANHSGQRDGESFKQAQDSGFYSLLFLAKALAKQNVGHEIGLFVLSNNIQEVQGTETLCPEKSTVLGPCMVIPQEYPNIRTKSIDLDWSGHAEANELTIERVWGELFLSDSELFVAYRNAQRWVQTYEQVALDNPAPDAPVFREGGVYLITGGLGNIGYEFSKYLAKSYRAKLVLVGRSSLPERESWNASTESRPADNSIRDKIDRIVEIEKLGGDVLYLNACVADLSGMQGVIDQTRRRFGTLHGVIHGAGIVGEKGICEIVNIETSVCDSHFKAKAHSLNVLEKILDGQRLDFCMLLSSLTPILGGIGEVAYSSSNVFMDTFARKHNRSSPSPWISVNWDLWRLQKRSASNTGIGKTLEELGITSEEGMKVMGFIMPMKAVPQLVVSTGDLDARIRQWIKLDSLRKEIFGDRSCKAISGGNERPKLQKRCNSPGDQIEQVVAQIWQDALGIENVGAGDNFAELGGHSLLAIKIVSELRKAFHVDLPVRALLDASTVGELANYIKNQIVAEIEALSDEEARQLVSNS
jgi:acyl transferase domain-containing protein/acyl carrier protein